VCDSGPHSQSCSIKSSSKIYQFDCCSFFKILTITNYVGVAQLVRAGRYENRSPMKASFFVSSGLCIMNTRSFPRVTRPEHGADYPPSSSAGSRMGRRYRLPSVVA